MWSKWHNQCQSDYHETNDKQNPWLYGVNMYIQCFVLHIVLNNSKSQQDGEHCSFQSMNTEKGVAINQISSLSYISHPVILLQGIIAFGAGHLILMSLS